jgi:hypothetical protein
VNLTRRPRAHATALAIILFMLGGLLASVAPSASAHTDTKAISLTNATTQSGRVFRDAVPSACGTPKAYPGGTNGGTTYNYSTSTYVAVATGCLTVTRVSADCGDATTDSANAHVVLYGGAYNPADQGANFVGDQGSSNNASSFGVDVTAGQTYTVVVSNTSTQANCSVQVKLEQDPDTKIAPLTGTHDTPTLTLSGSDANTYQCSVDSGAFAPCTSPAKMSGLSVGQHSLAVKAVDADGKVDATPATTTFDRCDRAKPTADVAAATKALKKAKKQLKAAKKSHQAQKIKKAKKKVKAAKKKLKAAKASLAACPA